MTTPSHEKSQPRSGGRPLWAEDAQMSLEETRATQLTTTQAADQHSSVLHTFYFRATKYWDSWLARKDSLVYGAQKVLSETSSKDT